MNFLQWLDGIDKRIILNVDKFSELCIKEFKLKDILKECWAVSKREIDIQPVICCKSMNPSYKFRIDENLNLMINTIDPHKIDNIELSKIQALIGEYFNHNWRSLPVQFREKHKGKIVDTGYSISDGPCSRRNFYWLLDYMFISFKLGQCGRAPCDTNEHYVYKRLGKYFWDRTGEPK